MKKAKRVLISLGLALVLALSMFMVAAQCVEFHTNNPIHSLVFLYVPQTHFERGTEFDETGMILRVTWEDPDKDQIDITLPDARITLSTINMNASPGQQTLTAAFTHIYDGVTHTRQAQTRITIVSPRPEGELRITNFEFPRTIREFRSNSDYLGTGIAGGRGFMALNDTYYVGAANEFRFFPEIWVQDEETRYSIPFNGQYRTNIRVYRRLLDDEEAGNDEYAGDDEYASNDEEAGNDEYVLSASDETDGASSIDQDQQNEYRYVLLTEDNISDWVSVNPFKDADDNTIYEGVFQFSEQAIGHNFRISHQIYCIYDVWMSEPEPLFNRVLALSVAVIDAVNVNNVNDFIRYFDNRSSVNPMLRHASSAHGGSVIDYNGEWHTTWYGAGHEGSIINAWHAFRGEDQDINGIVLHDNLVFRTTDASGNQLFPSEKFFQYDNTRGLSNLNRWQSMFIRSIRGEGNEFNFVGNYFNLDTENMPLIDDADTRFSVPNGIMSHLKFLGLNAHDGAVINFKNLSTRGNAPRRPDSQFGWGMGFMRAGGQVNLHNLVVTNHRMGFEFVGGDDVFDYEKDVINMTSIRGFDTWQEFLTANHHRVEIADSYLMHFGGAAIMMSDMYTRDDPYGPRVNIQNTQIESFNPSNAAWFHLNNLTPLVTQFMAIDAPIRDAFDRTIMSLGAINYIGIAQINFYPLNIQEHHVIRATLKMDGEYLINVDNSLEEMDIAFGMGSPANPVVPLISAGGHNFMSMPAGMAPHHPGTDILTFNLIPSMGIVELPLSIALTGNVPGVGAVPGLADDAAALMTDIKNARYAGVFLQPPNWGTLAVAVGLNRM